MSRAGVVWATTVILCSSPATGAAQAGSPGNDKQAAYGSKFLTAIEPNYFLFGFGDDSLVPGEYGHQVKFRVGVRYQVLSFYGGEAGLHVGYRQNSFWHLYETSAPFFDNNYNPQIFAAWDGRKHTKAFSPGARLMLEHESNGRDGVDSRSWNRLTAGFDLGDPDDDPAFGTLRLWHQFHVGAENADIRRYAGRGELDLYLQPWRKHGFDLAGLGMSTKLRLWSDDEPFPSAEVNLFVGGRVLPGRGVRAAAARHVNVSAMVQYFSGTAENLLTYKERHSVWRVGLATVR